MAVPQSGAQDLMHVSPVLLTASKLIAALLSPHFRVENSSSAYKKLRQNDTLPTRKQCGGQGCHLVTKEPTNPRHREPQLTTPAHIADNTALPHMGHPFHRTRTAAQEKWCGVTYNRRADSRPQQLGCRVRAMAPFLTLNRSRATQRDAGDREGDRTWQ